MSRTLRLGEALLAMGGLVTVGTGPLQGIAAQISPKAAEAAYVGMPLVLIWVVEKK